MSWFRKRREAKRAEEEHRQAMSRAAKEFESMSKGAKVLLSHYDDSSPTGRYGGLTFEYVFFNHRNSVFSYENEIIRRWATDDFDALKDSASGNERDSLGAHDFKGMLFNESRIRHTSRKFGFSVGEITEREWDMIVKRYLRHFSSLKKEDVALQRSLVSVENVGERTFQRLAYIQQSLDEIAARGDVGDVSEAQWLEQFRHSVPLSP